MRSADFRHEAPIARRPHNIAASDIAGVRLILAVHFGKPVPPGSDAGLSNIIRDTAAVLRKNGVQTEVWGVRSADQLIAKIEADEWRTHRPITHVVINPPLGYYFPDMFGVMAQRWPNISGK